VTGNHTVVLTVTDNDGARHYDTLNVQINSLNNTHIWIEAECSHVGSNWNLLTDASASNGKSVMVRAGTQRLTDPSADSSDLVLFNFYISEPGAFKLWGRTKTPSANDDSFWVRMDSGSWTNWNGIPTGSLWQWDDVHDQSGGPVMIYNLDTGYHKLTICYREDGAGLDKLYLTNTGMIPSGIGETAENCIISTIEEQHYPVLKGVKIYPNPLRSAAQISSDFPFNSLVISNSDGRIRVHKKYPFPVQTAYILLDLEPGIYALKLNKGEKTGVTRFMVE
jgi:hypothetical protein